MSAPGGGGMGLGPGVSGATAQEAEIVASKMAVIFSQGKEPERKQVQLSMSTVRSLRFPTMWANLGYLR